MRVAWLFVLLMQVLGVPAQASERVLRLAAVEWPPYASENLSEQGAVTDTLRRALAAMGVTLEVEFHPNAAAALKQAEAGGSCAGYYPVRFSHQSDRHWALSEPIGGSPLGFAQRSDTAINWTKLDHLRNRHIGVVLDAVADTPLERRIDKGDLMIDYASDDVTNLKRLGTYHTELAVIDAYVFAYLMANDPRLSEYRGQLIMNARIFALKSLHVAFRKDANGRRMAKLLAQGLKKIGYEPPVFSPD